MVSHRKNLSKDDPEGLVAEDAFEVCGVGHELKSPQALLLSY